MRPIQSITNRNASIDFLRGIAILLVIITHINWLPSKLLGQIFYPLNLGGWMGVDLFYVLSGYLISSLLFTEYRRTGAISTKMFLIRRGFKIYPAFWFLLIVTCLAKTFLNLHSDGAVVVTGTNYLYELLFIQNYYNGVWGHTWSLAIEEHFYLLFAGFLYITTKYYKLNFKVIAFAYLLLLLVCLFFRFYYNFIAYDSEYELNSAMTHLRIDALFFGVLLSYVSMYKPAVIKRFVSYKAILLPLFFFLLILSIYFGRSTKWGVVFLLLTNSWAFGYLLITAIHFNWGTSRFMRPIIVTGKYSYSIYLWHIVVKEWVVSKQTLDYVGINLKWSNQQVLYILLSIVCGIAFSKLIEMPFIYLRDRYFPSQVKTKEEHSLSVLV
ncbi:peptidoglycan/LPS O-acetylase OafA/YrhL [Lacibacter cauensis]|uniref:Peptidoglycan/LPS O-acetylase OafA/YrhL n=1 Tax=Lacibacter cauensis TaxID=510947 RepID=A0A562SJH3_9BACT|nr:acyltransferase [Lacibacter cauensis]TWI81407.1 peptidoglycan/LPS O-acetylase OafA/YrhL [Lacibacter cauensis]